MGWGGFVLKEKLLGSSPELGLGRLGAAMRGPSRQMYRCAAHDAASDGKWEMRGRC